LAEAEDTAGAVAMAVEAATAMSVAVENDAMAAEEEVPVAIGAITGARAEADMVATEGVVAMVTAEDMAAATTTTTISRQANRF
jgi:hypothetical protein